jgi:hypothetical protein
MATVESSVLTSRSRQQIDDLEHLLQRMLALPVVELEEPLPGMDSPAAAQRGLSWEAHAPGDAAVTAADPASGAPTLVETVRPQSTGIAASSSQSGGYASPVPAETPASTAVAFAPQALAADQDASPDLEGARGTGAVGGPASAETAAADQPAAAEGRLIAGSLLGWLGIAMLVAALVWACMEWMGWTW